MKRILISVVIIAVIIAMGCSAIAYIDSHNNRLYGHIDMVLKAYEDGSGVEEKINDLSRFFESYEKRLSCIVNEEVLNEMSASISRLMPMYESDSDEFTAECETLRSFAERIQNSETPTWYRIL